MAGEESSNPSEAFDAGVTPSEAFKGEGKPSEETTEPKEGDETTSKADEKPSSEQEGKTAAPESYEDFTLPEGVAPDEGEMAHFVEQAKAEGLTQEQAQSRLDMLLDWKQRADEKAFQYWESQSKEWIQQSKARGLFNGETLAAAQKGLKLLDDADGSFGKLLSQINVDKHPVMIAVFAAYGAARSEGDLDTSSGAVTQRRDAADVLFGNSSK